MPITGDKAVSYNTAAVVTDNYVVTQVELADMTHPINRTDSGKKVGAMVTVILTTGSVHALAIAEGGAPTDGWREQATATLITPS